MRINMRIHFVILVILFLLSGCDPKTERQASYIIRDPIIEPTCQINYPELVLPDSLGGLGVNGRIDISAYVTRGGTLIQFEINRMEFWTDSINYEIVYSQVPGEEHYKNYQKLNKYYPWITSCIAKFSFTPYTNNKLLNGIDTIIASITIELPRTKSMIFDS